MALWWETWLELADGFHHIASIWRVSQQIRLVPKMLEIRAVFNMYFPRTLRLLPLLVGFLKPEMSPFWNCIVP